MTNSILILDFGSQYTQLIARRVRELGVFSEILKFDTPLEIIKQKNPSGIILSGGPSSVLDTDAPLRSDLKELEAVAPLMGICYGMQLMTQQWGGVVEKSNKREYGLMGNQWQSAIGDIPLNHQVWMSHGDVIKVPPPDFEITARSQSGHPSAMRSEKSIAVQFHPEVTHTEHGTKILKNFIFDLCHSERNWSQNSIAQFLKQKISATVPEGDRVLCALSGGVDSTVVGTLLTQALGAERVTCVFVDTGLLRKNEYAEVLEKYKKIGLNVHGVNAEDQFLDRLEGVSDPEEKRKIIGKTFIDVFKGAMKDLNLEFRFLAQGTLYPDVIESVSPRGTSVTIKSHHNVGGLPKDLNLILVEPLRELFKDEVRHLGEQLGLPQEMLWRHPFPGPGLAIRIIGSIHRLDLNILKDVDAIFIEELKHSNLYQKIWQAFAVLLPIQTVGVQGDQRTYDKVAALRAVTSVDGMTADWFDFPPDFMRKVSSRITNEVQGVSRIVYDVTSKPPGTIEWE